MDAQKAQIVADLQAHMYRLQGYGSHGRPAIPFGIHEIDSRLPNGGLAVGTLHEVAGGGDGAIHGAAAAHFCAMMAARTIGKVFWCVTKLDLYAPALEQVGLDTDRLVIVRAKDQVGILSAMEECLRCTGVGAVVGELPRLQMTASRRLKHAAEKSGGLALALRRWTRPQDAADFGNPTASVTRWRITAAPSETLPVEGVGSPRFLVELIRATAGHSADYLLETDNEGSFCLPPAVANRTVAPRAGHVRAVA